MKKQWLVVLATVATMLIVLGNLVSPQGSETVVSVPGNTVVQDSKGDLLLRNCDSAHPGIPCSMPPGAPLDLPGYFDIKTAKITEIGKGWVDLSIALYEPIPAAPPYPDVEYIWQFKGGCVSPKPENKAGVAVFWDGKLWRAHWYVITSCDPRTFGLSDPVPFKFTEDGVEVQVVLKDLLTAIDPGEPLIWHATVRRVPFIYMLPGGVKMTYPVGADYVPDVIRLIPAPQYIDYPEDPATWRPR